jgi:dihydropteroate synthase
VLLIERGSPAVMAILNVTPDSFSDGGRFASVEAATDAAVAAAELGAELVDIGGESTRPGAAPVDVNEELRRVVPVVREIRRRSDLVISVDTSKSDVALAAIEAGADIVNDVSAGCFDPLMLERVAPTGAGFVLMHTTGRPHEMQALAEYGDVVAEVAEALRGRVEAAVLAGFAPERLAIDPGFGFGKQLGHNERIFARLKAFTRQPLPVVVGVSRKSMLRARVGSDAEALDHATTAAHTLATVRGAAVLRTHNVAAAIAARATCRALV